MLQFLHKARDMEIDDNSTKNLYRCACNSGQRIKESKEILTSFPGYVPLLVEKHFNSKLQNFRKKKLVMKKDMDVLRLQSVIRNQINLQDSETLSVFVHDGKLNRLTLLNLGSRLSDIYGKYKQDDGFLYVTYCEFSSFG